MQSPRLRTMGVMGWRTALSRVVLLLALPFACSAAGLQALDVPDRGANPVDAAYLQVLVARDTTDIVDVAAGSLESRMHPSTGEASVAFDPHNELWIRLDLRNPRGETQAVQLHCVGDDFVVFDGDGDGDDFAVVVAAGFGATSAGVGVDSTRVMDVVV